MKRIIICIIISLFFIIGALESKQFKKNAVLRVKKQSEIVENLGRKYTPIILNPSLHIRNMIISQYPNIAVDANEIIQLKGYNVTNDDEFRTLIYFLYLVNDHQNIASVVKSYNSPRSIIHYIDIIYLLPAFLYERMGLSELSAINYRRYLNLIVELSKRENLFYYRGSQRRLTIARIKNVFINQAIPSIRDEYYQSSYFSTVLKEFFPKYHFFLYYKAESYLQSPEISYFDSTFDSKNLLRFIKNYETSKTPYEQFELCAAQLRCDIDTSDFSIDNYISELPDTNYLKYLALFIKAQLNSHTNYLESFYDLQLILACDSLADAEFIRDDALLSSALLCVENNDNQLAGVMIKSLRDNFRAKGYDAPLYAESLFSSFNELTEDLTWYYFHAATFDDKEYANQLKKELEFKGIRRIEVCPDYFNGNKIRYKVLIGPGPKEQVPFIEGVLDPLSLNYKRYELEVK